MAWLEETMKWMWIAGTIVAVLAVMPAAAVAADPAAARQETREEIERFLAKTPAKTPAEVDIMVRGASPGFRFSVGDGLVNVKDGAEIGVVVRTETAHTFRNGKVGRAYVVARPKGVEVDMNADDLERIAAKR
ncbi:MAG TPA: hypothetical protein VET45_13275 [Candidatus Binatia bacterium]|nr:hypothetical protein [Candidatus Binatia bacterium]